MDIDKSRIHELISRPGESLSVELKRWIDPTQPEGISKIARSVLALRNHGGGYLVIGFDNDTLLPDTENAPENVEILFNIDTIQGIVSRYASESFEVTVLFPERENQLYPVIVVPSGVKTPVASRRDLLDEKNKTKLISTDDVYVRSLKANNTPSTTKARWNDWSNLVEVCFDNREANIGLFLRRHFGGITPEMLRDLASAIVKGIEPEVTTEDLLQSYLQESQERYNEVLKKRKFAIPLLGVWEVTLILIGDVPTHSANLEFLNLLNSSNPGYTGWPIWLDSRIIRNDDDNPFVVNGVWETLIARTSSGRVIILDYMRLNPKGCFYLRRVIEDDTSDNQQTLKPLAVFDFGLPIVRTAEAIAVGIAYAKAMGCDVENTLLAFAFQWTGLKDRELSAWAHPGRYISRGRRAYQDDFKTFVNVPLETPLSAINEFVYQVVQPLLEIFGGFSIGKDIVNDLTQRLIERRL